MRKEITLRLADGLWVLALLGVTALFALVLGAYSVSCVTRTEVCRPGRLTSWLSRAADVPDMINAARSELDAIVTHDPVPLLVETRDVQQHDWVRQFPSSADDGYLLLSGVVPALRHSAIQLIRVSDGAVMATWDPDWKAIFAGRSSNSSMRLQSINVARPFNPILLPDGDVVFNNDMSLIRMSPCDRKPVWVLGEPAHHSVELGADGNLWIPSISKSTLANRWLAERMQDDAIATVSLDGALLDRKSFADILIANGLQSLLFGVSGHELKADASHINEIRRASADSRYWRAGDLLISARHMSTVFIYRPSTGKIIWYKTGPWMNQHSAAFVGDHEIVVYDNNVISGAPPEAAFLKVGGGNRILVFDFDSGEVSEPYAPLLKGFQLRSITEGRVQVLDDGGLFIEETNIGRQLRFSRVSLLWSRINDYDKRRIGLVSWSTYLSRDNGLSAVRAVAARSCEATRTR